MREAETYRAQRRNGARANKVRFPWSGAPAKAIEAPPVRQNKRDRSALAEIKRADHVTMDFTGEGGIERAMVSHRHGTVYQKKPKRGSAAKRRRAPFETYFTGDRLHRARMRHKWYRKQVEAGAMPLAAE